MGWVRILVDGYSVLHQCLEIAPGQPRHGVVARDELVRLLAQYQDVMGIPITVVFDGNNASGKVCEEWSTWGLEVLYSPRGKTADDIIERVTHRFLEYGDVLVATDDYAEQNTVVSLGGSVSGVRAFMQEAEKRWAGFQDKLKRLNQREQRSFKRGI
ncbi:MAG: hypothetical protein M2R45_05492 [Verrucomicrobia subdivision 3 bacterium]|nr:hypothetical protein [Limisphaerales bacterium]